MSDLKPCPFCGNKHIHIEKVKKWFYRSYHVECWCCGASAESVVCIENAIKWWNNRAIDRDKLLRIAEELEIDPFLPGETYCGTLPTEEVLEFEREMAAQIRKAVGE